MSKEKNTEAPSVALDVAPALGLCVDQWLTPPRWGRGRIWPFRVDETLLALKEIAGESALGRLDDDQSRALFEPLANAQHLVLPCETAGRFVHNIGGQSYIVMPWLTPVTARTGLRLADHLGLAIEVGNELGLACDATFLAGAKRGALASDFSPESFGKRVDAASALLGRDLVGSCHCLLPQADRDIHTGLLHGDLNSSNIFVHAERFRVVDIDNLCLGDVYGDILHILIARGVKAEVWQKWIDTARRTLTLARERSVDASSIAFAVHRALGWLRAVTERIEQVLPGWCGIDEIGLEATAAMLEGPAGPLSVAVSSQVPVLLRGIKTAVDWGRRG